MTAPPLSAAKAPAAGLRPLLGRIAIPLLCLVLLSLAPLLSSFHLTLLNNMGLAALVTLGVVLLTGVGGLTSFGQAAFVGVGAYTTAWLSTGAGLPADWLQVTQSPWVALVAGLVITLAVAAVLGGLTLRLSGHYLPLGTMAWGISLSFLFGTFASLGGHTGLSGLPALHTGPWTLERGEELVVLIWGLVLLAWAGLRNLLDSRSGRAIRALNGGQAMAASMGVDVFRAKLATFLMAAALASLSGWLYAYTQRFVSPAPFSINAGIDYLFMALIGGVGQLGGALLGAALFTLAKEVLQNVLPSLTGSSGSWESIAFGLLIVWLMHRAPSGVLGWLRQHRPAPPVKSAAPRRNATALPRRSLPARGSPLLTVRGLTRRFGGLVANRDIDLDLAAGEILAVIGPNGAGKSTLFNQLSCCDVPSAGSIRFAGQPVAGWSAARIAAAGLGRTFQHVKLLPTMSVLENAALGAHLRGRHGLLRAMLRLERNEEAALLAEARHQLERVGLGEHLHLPAGQLALGQQRLLEIARALCADPSLLLLDEPAAGLRHLEKQALAALLRQLREDGMAVLIVEHDMDFVMNLVDRVVVVVFGEKMADGPPHEVRQDPRVLAAYLGSDDE